MAIRLLDGHAPSSLERLVDDYLSHCEARGLSRRTIAHSYGYTLHVVFLPWCASEGIDHVRDLDGRALDRYTTSLLRREKNGRPISKHTVHSYVRPVRQMLTWASRVGEEVKAKPQLPKLSMPARDTLTRDELAQLTPSSIIRSGRQAYLRVIGKGSRVRDVPIPPLLLRRLERHVEGRPRDRYADRIFLSSRTGPLGRFEPLTGSGLYQVVRDAAWRGRITKPVYPHLLRHSWMTEMLRNGMNPMQLSIIAGASLQVIQQHYTHLTKDDAYDAMLRVLTARGGR